MKDNEVVKGDFNERADEKMGYALDDSHIALYPKSHVVPEINQVLRGAALLQQQHPRLQPPSPLSFALYGGVHKPGTTLH